jgi:cytochrome c-type biogenesis protein CcmH/NrfG
MSRWFFPALMAGLVGSAAHGTLPPPKGVPDMAQQVQEADRAYASGDIRRAADLYASIVQRVPEDADAWFRLGNAQFRLQRPDEAVVAYQRAIAIRPDHARALYNLAVVRLKQAQAAMIASAQAGKPGDALRRDSSLIAQRLARVGEDIGAAADGDGGAPPFIVEPRDTR